MPFPQVLPYKSYSFLRPSSASETTIDGALTSSSERLTILCHRLLIAGCGSYPHFTGEETEAEHLTHAPTVTETRRDLNPGLYDSVSSVERLS